MLINIADIRPAQIDNSNTAASGEESLNIITLRTALVIASPIADRGSLGVITVQRANTTNTIRRTIFMAISTL
jgi:hypothetical protein